MPKPLDTLGLVVSMADRIDAQSKALEGIAKYVAEARVAAFAARRQTDPKLYIEIIGKGLDQESAPVLKQLTHALGLARGHQAEMSGASRSVRDSAQMASNVMWNAEQQALRWKRWLVYAAIGLFAGLLLAGFLVPSILAERAYTCGLMGGTWGTTASQMEVCTFFARWS